MWSKKWRQHPDERSQRLAIENRPCRFFACMMGIPSRWTSPTVCFLLQHHGDRRCRAQNLCNDSLAREAVLEVKLDLLARSVYTVERTIAATEMTGECVFQVAFPPPLRRAFRPGKSS